MKHTFLQYICCPLCGGALESREDEIHDELIVEGVLRCAHCAVEYAVHKGMPNLIAQNGWGQSKEPEMQGWVNLWAKKGMYGPDNYMQDSLKLPYIGGIWQDTARWFDIVLDDLKLTGKETILDLGAGQGWASRYFAERGCTAIAMDVVDDERLGLGRSWAIMEHAGVYFEPILGDGENMPFYPGTFDLVFLSSSLHHFAKIERVLQEIYRVLKPGGRIIAAPEPSIAFSLPERAAIHDIDEVREGITERRLKVGQFRWAFWRTGFRGIQIDTFETYRAAPMQLYSWIMAARHNHLRSPALRPSLKPVTWLVYKAALLLPPRLAGQLALMVNGGSLYLRATKPAKHRDNGPSNAGAAHGTPTG